MRNPEIDFSGYVTIILTERETKNARFRRIKRFYSPKL